MPRPTRCAPGGVMFRVLNGICSDSGVRFRDGDTIDNPPAILRSCVWRLELVVGPVLRARDDRQQIAGQKSVDRKVGAVDEVSSQHVVFSQRRWGLPPHAVRCSGAPGGG